MQVGAVLSRMDSTIGRLVGNSLEVVESLETLKGRGPDDLMELVTTLGEEHHIITVMLHNIMLYCRSNEIKLKLCIYKMEKKHSFSSNAITALIITITMSIITF